MSLAPGSGGLPGLRRIGPRFTLPAASLADPLHLYSPGLLAHLVAYWIIVARLQSLRQLALNRFIIVTSFQLLYHILGRYSLANLIVTGGVFRVCRLTLVAQVQDLHTPSPDAAPGEQAVLDRMQGIETGRRRPAAA